MPDLTLSADLVKSVMEQQSEFLGRNEVRWSVPLPEGDDEAVGTWKESLRVSFYEHIIAAFPHASLASEGISLDSCVYWRHERLRDESGYADLDAKCPAANISSIELADKARDFKLAGLNGKRLGPPKATGTDIPEDFTVVTVIDTELASLDDFKEHVNAAVTKQLSRCSVVRNDRAMLVDMWRGKRVIKASGGVSRQRSTNIIALVVELYDWMRFSEDPYPHAVAETSATTPMRGDRFLCSRPAYDTTHLWPGWLTVGKKTFKIDFPGRLDYCPFDHCVIMDEEDECAHKCWRCGGWHLAMDEKCAERITFGRNTVTPPPELSWELVKNEVGQKSEALGACGVRWLLPSPGKRADFDAILNGAVYSFCQQVRAALPQPPSTPEKQPIYPSVRWHGAARDSTIALSVDCAQSNISVADLVEKAQGFRLPGLTSRMRQPNIVGSELPAGIAVLTVRGVESDFLKEFQQHIDHAVLEQLCGRHQEYVVKIIDVWRLRGKKDDLADAIALVVKVYEWIPLSEADQDAISVHDLLGPAAPSSTPVRVGHVLRIASATQARDWWPGWLRLGEPYRKFRLDYPGRFKYCWYGRCAFTEPLESQWRWRHRAAACPYLCKVCGHHHINGNERCAELHRRPLRRCV